MKNKKYAITLSLEENEELMAEIDRLIRERAKAILREETTTLIDGTLQKEAKQIVQTKLSSMPNYEIRGIFKSAIENTLCRTTDLSEETRQIIRSWVDAKDEHFAAIVKSCCMQFVEMKLKDVVQADVVKAVVDALTKKVNTNE